jgi:hypothetical protein
MSFPVSLPRTAIPSEQNATNKTWFIGEDNTASFNVKVGNPSYSSNSSSADPVYPLS